MVKARGEVDYVHHLDHKGDTAWTPGPGQFVSTHAIPTAQVKPINLRLDMVKSEINIL